MYERPQSYVDAYKAGNRYTIEGYSGNIPIAGMDLTYKSAKDRAASAQQVYNRWTEDNSGYEDGSDKVTVYKGDWKHKSGREVRYLLMADDKFDKFYDLLKAERKGLPEPGDDGYFIKDGSGNVPPGFGTLDKDMSGTQDFYLRVKSPEEPNKLQDPFAAPGVFYDKERINSNTTLYVHYYKYEKKFRAVPILDYEDR